MSSNSSALMYSIDSFGPTVSGGFDFTLLFEETVLSILPSSILLAVLPIRLFSFRGKPRKVVRSHLYENKLVRWIGLIISHASFTNSAQLFLLAYTCMQAILLVLSTTTARLRTPTAVAASVLAVVDAIGLSLLSHTEHLYSLRPSGMLLP